MDPIDPALLATPGAYPLELSGSGEVRWLDLGEGDYRAASFLDGRMLEGRTARVGDWASFAEAARGLPRRAHFIFHIGHVGSTLLSRLLGEHPDLFGVREPALLREAARTGAPDILVLLALFARVWRPGQSALIKATSFVGEVAPDLLARAEDGRALLLSATPPVYLRTILAGEASLAEMEALLPFRAGRLAARLGPLPPVSTPGERIALGWLAGVTALEAARAAFPARCLWLDVDRLLLDPAGVVDASLRHLGADPAKVDLLALLAGPLLRRYAKAPEHAYDASLRRALLEEAGRRHGEEVRRGMDWLQRVADRHPAARGAMLAAAGAARGRL